MTYIAYADESDTSVPVWSGCCDAGPVSCPWGNLDDGNADDIDTRAGPGENPIAVCVLPGGCASRTRFNTSEDR